MPLQGHYHFAWDNVGAVRFAGMQLDGDPSADSRIDLRKDSEQPIATEVPSKENVRFVSLRGGQERLWCRDSLRSPGPPKGRFPSEKSPSVLSVMLAPSATPITDHILVVSGSHWTMLALRQTACCADSDTLEAQSDQFNEIKKSAHLGQRSGLRSPIWEQGHRTNILPSRHHP